MAMLAACPLHVAARGRAPLLVALVSLLLPGGPVFGTAHRAERHFGPQIASGHRDQPRRINTGRAKGLRSTLQTPNLRQRDGQRAAFLQAALEALERQTSNKSKGTSFELQHGPVPSSLGQWTPEVVLTQKLTDMLKFSMVRIIGNQAVVNWFKPNEDSKQRVIVGAGFAAQLIDGQTRIPANAEEDPVFVTSSLVVSNSRNVKIQFPALGRREFRAYTPLIFQDRDLAILKLESNDKQEFLDYLKSNDVKLQFLPIREHEVALGENVAAIGFPMASSTAKLSTGVIAGTELVWGSTVFQSTAPVSPGSDGGPLLALGDALEEDETKELRVIGVNFVAPQEAGAENVNFAMPLVYIRQLFRKYQKLPQDQATHQQHGGMLLKREPLVANCEDCHHGHTAPTAHHSMDNRHVSLKLGPTGALIEHANREMLWLANCSTGPLIKRIQEQSVLHFAKPPIEEYSFVQAVDGVAIDPFGEGRPKAGFLRDPMPLESLMQVSEDVESDVEVMICREGKISKHMVSMAWRAEYEKGIRWIEEPAYEEKALDYEVFAGVTVMQMTSNHVWTLIQARVPYLGKWLLPENRNKPRLVIADVETGSWAEKVLWPGTVLESLNGHNVTTLDDFRTHFIPEDDLWRLVTDDKDIFVAGFQKSVLEQCDKITQMGKQHLGTPGFMSAAHDRNCLES